MSGWPSDVWLLGFAAKGLIGATYGLFVYSAGVVLVTRWRVRPAVAFLGCGITAVVASRLAFGAPLSHQGPGNAHVIAMGLVGACIGCIVYAVHMRLPSNPVKRTAGEVVVLTDPGIPDDR